MFEMELTGGQRRRVVLLGGAGFVGSAFARAVAERGWQALSVGRADCRTYEVDELARHLERLRADGLINCAGYTGKPNVDACERHKAECLAGNAVLPGVIAEACQRLDLPWGHVSSGCIYTGAKAGGLGFTEQDPPNFSFRQNNCSFYSGTKALGEEVLADAARCYIWRLRIPFSHEDSPRNYLSKLMRYDRLLDARNSLSCLPEFVESCLDCWERQLPFGIYNLTNPGSVTTREVVELIREAGRTDKEFRFFDSEADFMSRAAITPRSNCVLDVSKALSAGLKLSPIREALQHALKSWERAESQPSN